MRSPGAFIWGVLDRLLDELLRHALRAHELLEVPHQPRRLEDVLCYWPGLIDLLHEDFVLCVLSPSPESLVPPLRVELAPDSSQPLLSLGFVGHCAHFLTNKVKAIFACHNIFLDIKPIWKVQKHALDTQNTF